MATLSFPTEAVEHLNQSSDRRGVIEQLAAIAQQVEDVLAGLPQDADYVKEWQHAGEMLADAMDTLKRTHEAEKREAVERDSLVYRELFNFFTEIDEYVLENLPFAHPVRRAFSDIVEPLENNDVQPSLKSLREAVSLFIALGEDERRRIFNGWTLPQNIHSNAVEDIIERAKDDGHATGLMFFCHPPGVDREKFGELMNFSTGHSSPVHVFIRAGTPKMVALESIRNLAHDLERYWLWLVGKPGKPVPKNYLDGNPGTSLFY